MLLRVADQRFIQTGTRGHGVHGSREPIRVLNTPLDEGDGGDQPPKHVLEEFFFGADCFFFLDAFE